MIILVITIPSHSYAGRKNWRCIVKKPGASQPATGPCWGIPATSTSLCSIRHPLIAVIFLTSQREKKKQSYIHYSFESPVWGGADTLLKMGTFFNGSMSYRLDSTFVRRWGSIKKVKDHPASWTELKGIIQNFGERNRHISKKSANQTALVSWFVSHCKTFSRRESLVEELRRHIPVDIFGTCPFGNQVCGKKEGEDCLKLLHLKYKFYLSFENSICKDYVTEKYFKILPYDVIPVVFNGGDMSKLGPPHSFINAKDFSSMKELADYLLKVDSDDQLFASYFWWREYYSKPTGKNEEGKKVICDICSALHDPSRKEVVFNMHDWWVKDAHCEKNL